MFDKRRSIVFDRETWVELWTRKATSYQETMLGVILLSETR